MVVSRDQSLKAKYQVAKNIFVTCSMDIIEDNSADKLKAQVGIRKPGDVIVPAGTKLYIGSMTSPLSEDKSELEVFYTISQGVEIMNGVPVQVCSSITKEVRFNNRETPRKDFQLELVMAGQEEIKFITTRGSTAGLTLLCNTPQRLTGMVIGRQLSLQTVYNGNIILFSVAITHIHYDWLSYRHMLGTRLVGLSSDQEFVLNRYMDPNYKVEMKKQSTIDSDEARIRGQ